MAELIRSGSSESSCMGDGLFFSPGQKQVNAVISLSPHSNTGTNTLRLRGGRDRVRDGNSACPAAAQGSNKLVVMAL